MIYVRVDLCETTHISAALTQEKCFQRSFKAFCQVMSRCICLSVYRLVIVVLKKKKIKCVSNSIQGTCGYGPGSRDVGQQNYHQRSEELPQVSSPHKLCVFQLSGIIITSIMPLSKPPWCQSHIQHCQCLTKAGGCIQKTYVHSHKQ